MSWWSTYHQKRKAALNSLAEKANSLAAEIPHIAAGQMISSTVPVQQSNSAPQGTTVPVTPSTCPFTVPSIPLPASTVTVQPTAPTTSENTVRDTPVASGAPCTLQTTASTVPVQQTAPATSGNTVQVISVASGAQLTLHATVSPQDHASPVYGIPSSHTPCITEWNFPVNFTQSTLLGWLGSNAQGYPTNCSSEITALHPFHPWLASCH